LKPKPRTRHKLEDVVKLLHREIRTIIGNWTIDGKSDVKMKVRSGSWVKVGESL